MKSDVVAGREPVLPWPGEMLSGLLPRAGRAFAVPSREEPASPGELMLLEKGAGRSASSARAAKNVSRRPGSDIVLAG